MNPPDQTRKKHAPSFDEGDKIGTGLEQKNREIRGLYEVARKLSETLDLKAVYRVIFDEIAMKLLTCPNMLVALFDEKTETIYFDFAVIGGGEKDVSSINTFKLGEGPISDTIRNRHPQIVDIQETWNDLQAKGRVLGFSGDRPPQSGLFVPLISLDKVLGVITLQHHEKDAFETTDLDLLATLASQASIAIQNARYVERIRRDTEELNATLLEIKETERTLLRRDAILESISFAAQQFLQMINWRESIQGVLLRLGAAAEVSRVYIFENEWLPNNMVAASQRYEWTAPGIEPQIDNPDLQSLPYQEVGLHDWEKTMMEGKLVKGLVEDFSEEIQALLIPQNILSLLAVPIFVGETWWGFLGFDDCVTRRIWSNVELEAIKTAANLFGAAIQRERTETSIQRRNEELTGLSEIAEAFNVLTEPYETYQVLTGRLAKILGVKYCLVATLNEFTGDIEAQVPAFGIPDEEVLKIRYPSDQGGRIWDFTQRGVFYTNQFEDIPAYFQPFAQALDLHTILAAPLVIRDKFAGVVFAANKPDGFHPDDIRLMHVFASQVGLVIDKMRLFQTTQKQLLQQYALYTVANAAVTATEEDALITKVTEVIADQLYSDNFGILLRDKNEDVLRVHPSYRGVSGADRQIVLPLTEKSVAARVASTGEPYISQNVSEDDHYLEIVADMRSEVCVPIKVGETVIGVINAESRMDNAFQQDDLILITTLAGQLSAAIERIRTEKQEKEQRALAEALRDAVMVLNSDLDFESIQENILDIVGRVVPHVTSTIMIIEDGVARVMRHRGFEKLGSTDWLKNYSLDISEAKNIQEIVQTRMPVIVSTTQGDPRWIPREGIEWIRSYIGAPILHEGEVVGILNLDHDQAGFYNEYHAQSLNAFASQVAVAMENARLFEAQKQRSTELSILLQVSSELRGASLQGNLFPRILRQIEALVETQAVFIGLYSHSKEEISIELGNGLWKDYTGTRMKMDECACARAVYTSQPFFIPSEELANQFSKFPMVRGVNFIVCIPLKTQNLNLGILSIGLQGNLHQDKARILMGVADIAAGSIHRASLLEQTTLRLQRLEALRTIDNAINSSLDLPFTLNLLLDQVVSQLGVDAANLMLFNPAFQILDHGASKGFLTLSVKNISVRVGQGPAGRAVQNRKLIYVPNLREITESQERAKMIVEERFISYCSHPLISKGQVVGLLEIFQRSLLAPDEEWFDFFETLAGQAAIAIDNAQLFKDLQDKNQELIRMYDTTLEGWVYALDLRDKETEGHSRRVMELTLQLAQRLGVKDDELVHIRRGALLHDIGKIGVPDNILHKPGKLTEEEWEMMRKHPEFAYKMLSSISYLRPALEIPYCHHEKWDGTGYPRGFKGEEIPLSARIFAVVDVWDALRSDRPYRKAWPHEDVLNYIAEQAGSHFDPRIVDAFIALMEDEGDMLISWHP